MKTLKYSMLVIIAGLVFFNSCKDEDSSDGALLLKMQAVNKSYPLLKSTAVATPIFAWDTCFINVSEIEFQAEKHENQQSESSFEVTYEWKGPKKVDLFNPGTSLGEFDLQPGVYDEISLEIQSNKSDIGTSPIFYLSGNYTSSTGAKTRIIIISNDDLEFEVEQEGAVFNGINDYTALITFQLDLLTADLTQADIENATRTGSSIIISKNSNNTLFQKLSLKMSECEDVEFED